MAKKEINDKDKFKERIIPIRVYISKALYSEIKKAKKSLQEKEKQKSSGKKKKRWTFLETSDNLGKYLNSLRNKK